MADIRVGGAYVTFSAQAGPYQRGANQVIAANQRVGASINGLTGVVGKFQASIGASLIATAAYAAGVGAVAAVFRSGIGGALDYNEGLIALEKTTNVTGAALDTLGERISRISTVGLDGRKALGLLNTELQAIATVVGQAGITSPIDIASLTQTAAALQSSSDLIGRDAVRALTKYLLVTDQSIDRANALASAYVNLGNKANLVESEIASFSTRLAQNLAGVAKLSDGFLLGLSATLIEAGAREEAATSVVQKLLSAAVSSISEGTGEFDNVALAAGATRAEIKALSDEFLDGTASAKEYERAFELIVTGLGKLPQASRQGLTFKTALEGILGEGNIRATATLGTLTKVLPRLRRNIDLANEGLISQEAHFIEAEKAAESYRKRILIAGNELREELRSIGLDGAEALTFLAENFKTIGAGALGLGAVLAASFASRRLTSGIAGVRAATAGLVQDQTRAGQVIVQSTLARSNAQVILAAETDRTSKRARAALQAQGKQTNILAGARKDYANSTALLAKRTGVAAVAARGLGAAFGGLLNPTTALLIGVPLLAAGIASIRSESDDATEAFLSLRKALKEGDEAAVVERAGFVGLSKGLVGIAEAVRINEEKVRFLSVALGAIPAGRADTSLDRVRKAAVEAGIPLERTNEIITALRNNIFGLNTAGSGIGLLGVNQKGLEEARAEFERLAELGRSDLAAKNTSADAVLNRVADAAKPAVAGVRSLSREFEALNSGLGTAGQVVEQFNRGLNESLYDQRLLARRDVFLAGLSEEEEAFQRLAFVRSEALKGERRRLQNAVSDQREVVANLDALAKESESRVIGFVGGTEQEKAQKKEAEAFEKKLAAARFDLAIKEKAFALGQSELQLTRDQLRVIRETVAYRGQTETERLRNFKPDPVFADSVGAASGARETVEALREEVALAERRNQQAADLVGLSDRQKAIETARADALATFAEAQHATERGIFDARQQIADTEREIARLRGLGTDDALSASNALAQTLEEQKKVVEAALLELKVRGATADEVARLAEQLAGIAAIKFDADNSLFPELDSLAALAAQAIDFRAVMQGNQEEVRKLADLVDGPLASAFSAVGDAVFSVFKDGEFNARRFAESIVESVIKSLIQTIIVANLARAATSFLGGFGGGGATAVPSTGSIGVFHSGGVEPNQKRALNTPLRSNERFAILLKNEEVLTRDDPRHRWNFRGPFPKYHQGGVVGSDGGGNNSGGIPKIEIINPPGRQDQQIDRTEQRLDIDGMVLSVFLKDSRKNGPITRGIKQIAGGGR